MDTTHTETTDPRPRFDRALDQTDHLVAAVLPGELAAPTPCAEYDVRALCGHMVAVLDKLARLGAGRSAAEVPDVVDVADDHAGAFRRARAEVEHVWRDDAVLDRRIALPWATLPGREALTAYTHEFTVHSWDLAHATNRRTGLDEALAADALAWFARFEPSEARGEQGPFGAAVPVPDDADAYTRLAGFVGRHPS
ncbi:TIGR03086 family metal-binding protein [Streptomonospora litoralis]|uniref:Mycothiol-dependent maleylpyruvate isomerase metal-binding domain-containing protein n=1 Tax=Streptomonospora litoralis TaxID=2498135 RepID=A0A4P6Q1A7_9ACTN|nr:TIGR03086 family metal-binding protein [Streptomonospora litoralis]QBI54358.1 hypothetical protein EKD16_12880 [Streptomonospora litoralis]